MTQPSRPPAASLSGDFESLSSILNLERDSQSAELQSYLDQADIDAHGSPNASSQLSAEPGMDTTNPITTPVKAGSAHQRGSNWSAIDRLCFITALDNYNPWVTASSADALTAWTEAIDDTNKALTKHGRQTRNHGAFEAQWRKMVVRDQKQLRLRATGANFDEDEVYQLLYNLVYLYNASPLKLAFLKPQDDNPTPPSSSLADRHECQKRKQAMTVARQAGLTGQTLALQRLRDRRRSTTSDSMEDESQEPLTDQDGDKHIDTQTMPTLKRRKTL